MKKVNALLIVVFVTLGYSLSAVAAAITNQWAVQNTAAINCGTAPHGFWTFSLDASASTCNNFFSFNTGSTLTEYDDGTAVLSASATNQDGISADINIDFGAYTTVHGNVKTDGGPQLASWYYYETITSGNVSVLGVSYDITLLNPDLVLQIGIGANDKTDAFGASVWIDADDGLVDGYTGGRWDLNIDLVAVPVPAAVWLFGSGLLGLVCVARRKT